MMCFAINKDHWIIDSRGFTIHKYSADEKALGWLKCSI